jgi:hypothetical protein
MPTIESEHRRSYVERVLDTTRDVLADASVKYDVNGKPIDLALLLENAVAADIDDEGTVTISDDIAETNSVAVVALTKDERVTIGAGFDSQSPIQRQNSFDTFKKWDMADEAAEELLAYFASNLALTKGALSTGIPPVSEASTYSAGLAFNLQSIKETYIVPEAPSSPMGKIAARALVIFKYDTSNSPQPQLVAHELAHYADKTENPVKLLSSQRSIDMRTLRDELKAYNVGAQVAKHIVRTTPLSLSEIKKQLSNDQQLLVDYIRQVVNADDNDQFRVSPELVARLEKEGITFDHIIHGRHNFDQMAKNVGLA